MVTLKCTATSGQDVPHESNTNNHHREVSIIKFMKVMKFSPASRIVMVTYRQIQYFAHAPTNPSTSTKFLVTKSWCIEGYSSPF